MSKIIILSQSDTAMKFTAVTSAPDVTAIGNSDGTLYDATRKSIHRSSNINLLSLGYYIPFGFEFISSDIANFYNTIEFGVETSGTKTVLDSFILPFRNYEIAIGKYYNLSATPNKKFFARFTGFYPKISMKNVPTEFNGQTFTVPIFCKFSSLTGME